MRTAVSIPDPLFDAAEDLAGHLGVTRSELYAKALDDSVRTHRHDGVTEALNRVYAKHSSKLDPVLEKMQYASLAPDFHEPLLEEILRAFERE